jgi:transcriptional regulator with XRE-family HTH domain
MSIDPASLARRIRERRLSAGNGIREAAEEADVSPATLSRLERGDYVPGRENLLKIAAWLGVTVDELTETGHAAKHEGEPESTPEAVALHLRADKKLTPEDAAVLEQVFRSAYNALAKRKTGTR